jgi:cysteine desulfurase
MKLPIYMDYHATTPVDPRVVQAMLPFFTEHFGNAASRNHPFGWEAEEAVEAARKQVADLIGASAKEVIFTSGATESNNLAIKGVAEMYREKGNHIITCVTEHKAVIDTCKKLEKNGYRVTYLQVQKDGRIDLEELRAAIIRRGFGRDSVRPRESEGEGLVERAAPLELAIDTTGAAGIDSVLLSPYRSVHLVLYYVVF